MNLKFCGGAQAVTGVNYLFTTARTKFIVDCGLFQGTRDLEIKNTEPFIYDPQTIDFALISHAHLDHIGRLPRLVKEGFVGQIYATPPTIDFARLLLEDAQKLMAEKTKKADVMPLTTPGDVEKVMKLFVPVEYEKEISPSPDVSFTFYDAGHILGSCITKIKIKEKGDIKTIVHSGDLGNHPAPILRTPALIEQADYVLVESTYGDRLHLHEETSAKDLLEDVIEETVSRGGALMIPSFAMERTQQLLYQLNDLIENGRIPKVPVYIDSPLAIKITEMYKKYENYFDQSADALVRSGDDIFDFPNLHFTETTEQSKQINEVPPPKIIIAGSGMSQGGRIIHHETRYLPDPKSTLMIVAYQAEGTLGRRLAEGVKRVKIFDEEVLVRAQVVQLEAYSAHADQQGLLRWLGHFQKPLKKIFVVQGEQAASRALAVKIRDDLGVASLVPIFGQEVTL
ncbi:MAG: MBL fold hydrolase [Candidatus Portnoybacteria bacterium CG10_big_fil_rev_8_21_14_0_10_44_7]|uniref:MBL fold hydrolase n=1 Tax=Candidatus Portnoybacteria bacterium CG10_big_fil_rev_8_21_14_0_10_44_7 TaxID=1974816 RepID=A0A2M8KJ84_9BACT|nr:MAG: MBL fold hydrolase [Candidatus Portnoybacteria bacterium CG10_big_fil_rev_8_21_14_0_10_44_7]